MRQATMTAPGVIRIDDDVPAPTPGAGQVAIRVRRIGVCGSDVHVNHGKHPFTSYPVIQGHEYAGVVEQVGTGVTDVRPGIKVTATPQQVCGKCPPCRRGDYHICDQLKVEGFQAPGAARDVFVVNEDQIVQLPEAFTFEQGAMVEPVAVAVHAAARGGVVRDCNVAVIGAGPIGNLAAQVLRAAGARVMITDVSDYRLEVARACGIEHAFNANTLSLDDASREAFGDEGFSLAFDCAGAPAAMGQLVKHVAKGGAIVVVAVYEEPAAIDLALVQDRELTITGTLMYQKRDYAQAVSLIEGGKVVVEPLDSRHFPFEQYADAYRFIDEQGQSCMKVFIDL